MDKATVVVIVFFTFFCTALIIIASFSGFLMIALKVLRKREFKKIFGVGPKDPSALEKVLKTMDSIKNSLNDEFSCSSGKFINGSVDELNEFNQSFSLLSIWRERNEIVEEKGRLLEEAFSLARIFKFLN